MNKIKHEKVIDYLRTLDQVKDMIFSAYIQRDYFSYQVVYEKKLTKMTQILFKKLDLIRNSENVIVSQLENLYEILFSIDLLKHRMLDHATFEVCESEFKKINQSISIAFNKMDMTSLNKAIQLFEVIFQTTLQFITADPLYFLFFIRDIKSLAEEMHCLSDYLNENVTKSMD